MLVALILFFACADDEPTKPVNKITGIKVLDTTLQSSTGDAIIEVAEKITINIPKENISDGAKLTIHELRQSEIPVDTLVTYYSAYDIKLSTGSEFEEAITITINFDKANFPEEYIPGIIGAAWYDEEGKKWIQYSGAEVDTINYTVTYQTNHLSLHAIWTRWGFRFHRGTEHFNVYWKWGKDMPIPNSEYNNEQPWHDHIDPHYIQDMCQYLEQAYTAYKNLGLTVPTQSKVDVWVQPLTGDGLCSFSGNLHIHSKCEGFRHQPAKVAMPMAVAHEFLHYIQDYYYVQLFSQYSTMWWLEATATQGDRMVWPSNPIFESVDFCNNEIDKYIHISWDDCSKDPNWYIAGGFLAYISAYRLGQKASIAYLLKKVGELGLSYTRTIIDDYLKDSLSSKGIGIEYAQYLKAAYEEIIPITFKSEWISPGVDIPCDIKIFLTNSNCTTKVKYKMPYLSGKFIKMQLHEKNDIPRSLKIIPATLPSYVKAYLYYDGVYKREINPGDKIRTMIHTKKLDIANKKIHILLVNTSKDKSANIEFDIEMQKFDQGNIFIRHKIDGKALSLHGNEAMFNFHGEVLGKYPIEIESIKHEAVDAMFEYPQRILTVKLTTGAYTGCILNPVIKFREPLVTKIDSSMIENGFIWTWKDFINGTVSCLNRLTGKTEVREFNGENITLEGFYHLGDMEIRSNVETEYEPVEGESITICYNYIVKFQLE
jgi:hypothetical protein